MRYEAPTIKQYERGAVLQYTGRDGAVHTIKNEERQENEIWTRVMGYYRPVSAFNLGKVSEHNERVMFKIPKEAQ